MSDKLLLLRYHSGQHFVIMADERGLNFIVKFFQDIEEVIEVQAASSLGILLGLHETRKENAADPAVDWKRKPYERS